MSENRLVVIDGYSLLYRAFFATRYLSTSDGRPTNALFGFTTMLFNLIEKEMPTAIVVALDAPGKTFRHAEYAAYKGTRKETAEELKVQLKASRELIAALGIPSIELVGFEADDVVGTIAKLAESNGYLTTIVTGDLDSLQLVDDKISVLTLKTGVTDTVTYDPAAVVERYGFGPEHVPDFKALKGDTSDNIPGVPGIGDKGAADLINRWGTIENMLDHFSEIEPKFQKKIEGNEAQMRQSKMLATIICDVPINYDFKPFALTQEAMEQVKAILESYEFKGPLRRADLVLGPYVEGAESRPAAVEAKLEAIETESITLRDFDSLRAFVGEKPFGLYVAASALQSSLFDDGAPQALVAVGKQVAAIPLDQAAELLRQNPSKAIMHDAKPLYRRAFGAERVPHPQFDSVIAAFVLQSGRTSYALADLIQGYLDASHPEKPEQLAVALPLLQSAMRDRLEKEGQTKVLDTIELPLIPILARMESLGIRADRRKLKDFSIELEKEISRVQAIIYSLAGLEFKIGSPKQLGEILFEKMNLPGGQKTKTGWATGVEVLGNLAAEYEIVGHVLNWRELSKLKSTYADALERLIGEDGRIHTTYNQTGAATGRLSSNDPNLQNIPIRTELGRGIRRAFIAADGYTLASADYSQIELRVLAHMCQEPALVDAFQNHEDVHSVTAASIFNLGDTKPTKEQRRLAKMLNYAVLYGVTEYGLAQQLGAGFSVSEAKELIRQYNERFPSVLSFTQSIVQDAKSTGFTTTLMGRRRYFPDIHAARIMERKYAERQAMNAPIQGTAADMLKLAMIEVDKTMDGNRSRLLLNVHDELVFEIADGDTATMPTITHQMETALPLSVPIEVDAKSGENWDEMTPLVYSKPMVPFQRPEYTATVTFRFTSSSPNEYTRLKVAFDQAGWQLVDSGVFTKDVANIHESFEGIGLLLRQYGKIGDAQYLSFSVARITSEKVGIRGQGNFPTAKDEIMKLPLPPL